MIKTTETEVTPAMADVWMLRHNTRIADGSFKQRIVSLGTINKYANDMKGGNWSLSPDPITFDENDNLINGQHRLEAIRMAKIPVKLMVSTGWPTIRSNGSLKLSTIDTIDRGRVRSTANQLQIHGVVNAAFVAAAVNSAVRVLYGGKNMAISYATTCTILRGYGMQDHIDELTTQGTSGKQLGWLFGPVTLYHYSKPKKANEFMRQFLNLDFDKNSGPWLLARYASNEAKANKTQESRVRSTCACLKVEDIGDPVGFFKPSTASCEWLADLNPKLKESLRNLIGTRK